MMHKKIHETGARYCHYYNNSKHCPYDAIGCKFLHENSGACTFSPCINSLCQFEHSEISDPIKNSDIETLGDSENDSVTYGENDCHLCDKTFTCLNSLCDHFQRCHEEYYIKTQNLVVF